MCDIEIKRLSEHRFELKNRGPRPFSEDYFLAWFLEHEGMVIDKGEIVTDAPAGGCSTFRLEHELPEEGTVSLLFSAVTARDSERSARDREAYFAQFLLKDGQKPLTEACTLPLKAEQTESVFAVHSPFFAHAFSKTLCPMQMVVQGESLLATPARMHADGREITVFRPTLRAGRTEAKISALYAALEGETPLAAGSMGWYCYGNGDAVLLLSPDREGLPVTLCLALRPELDYAEHFAVMEHRTETGCTGELLSLREGPVGAQVCTGSALRRLSLSSGEATMHVTCEHPVGFSLGGGELCLTLTGENRIRFSFEKEGE